MGGEREREREGFEILSLLDDVVVVVYFLMNFYIFIF